MKFLRERELFLEFLIYVMIGKQTKFLLKNNSKRKKLLGTDYRFTKNFIIYSVFTADRD